MYQRQLFLPILFRFSNFFVVYIHIHTTRLWTYSHAQVEEIICTLYHYGILNLNINVTVKLTLLRMRFPYTYYIFLLVLSDSERIRTSSAWLGYIYPNNCLHYSFRYLPNLLKNVVVYYFFLTMHEITRDTPHV